MSKDYENKVEPEIEISVVIPCYGCAQVFPVLIKRLNDALVNLQVSFEIILVDDCSKDSLRSVVEKHLPLYPGLRYIELMYNVGQFRATMCGLTHAKGRFVITMDDDLQHPPEEIEKLYAALRDNRSLDVVIGVYGERKHSLVRRIGSSLLIFLNRHMFRQKSGIRTSSFRCLRQTFVKALLANETHYPVIGPLILSSTNRILNVIVNHDERQNGVSGYTSFRLMRSTLDNILSFSSLPLQVISLFGIFVSFLSFSIGLMYLFLHLTREGGVAGWTSLFLAINFYGGLILLSVGLIGEYLIRIFNETKRQPLYIVRDSIEYEENRQQN